MAKIEIIDNGILIATLRGELDNHKANQIRSDISASIFTGQVRAVIWDLEGLGFMDSAGIGLILGRMRDLSPIGGKTLILNPSTTMNKIFGFSGLGENIRYCTIEEAIGEIGGVVHEQ